MDVFYASVCCTLEWSSERRYFALKKNTKRKSIDMVWRQRATQWKLTKHHIPSNRDGESGYEAQRHQLTILEIKKFPPVTLVHLLT